MDSTPLLTSEDPSKEVTPSSPFLPSSNPPRRTSLLVYVYAVASLFCLIVLTFSSVLTSFASHNKARVNVILMISDGFGPASETFAREYMRLSTGDEWATLPLDSILVGTSRTRSYDSLVTDSAAGAQAFSCAMKGYNGGIGVDPVTLAPCGTILEAAHDAGYLTGLAVTSRITHATPAVWNSHVVDRNMESEIAIFQAGAGPLGVTTDLMLGGGECFFRSKSDALSCRNDERDLIAEAQSNGYHVLSSPSATEEFYSATKKGVLPLPVLGFFNRDHMNYEIDRKSLPESVAEPTFAEMCLLAITTLSHHSRSRSRKHGGKGFFVMLEGSRIDMGAHSQDPIATIHDALAYNNAVEQVKAWVDESNARGEKTVLISTSDHETGGMTLARQLTPAYPNYAWYPSPLLNVTHSSIHLALELSTRFSAQSKVSDIKTFVTDHTIQRGLGIMDASDAEVESIVENYSKVAKLDDLLSDMVSRRAQIGWSTHGHSGVDVNIYSHGYHSERLRGNHENTDIGHFILDTLGLDLKDVTERLNRNASAWHDTESKIHHKGAKGIAHYHGEHR